MFASLSKYDVAQGLLSVDVPNIDIKSIKKIRCLMSANMYINKGKYTNAIVQLQTALLNECNYTSQVYHALNRIYNSQKLWNHMKDKPLTHEDMYKVLSTAYTSATNIWCRELVQDALLHDWPLPDEIPAIIMTNRLLSNNIFEYKQKTLKEE